jgi:predicted nucleic acid-binding protein
VFEVLPSGSVHNNNTLVLDNSVAMRWLFDDGSPSDRRYAASVLDHIQETNAGVIVPYVWVYESAFVVNFYVGQGDLEWRHGTNHLNSLYDLCTVAIDKVPPAGLFEFSHVHGISSYDAAYLLLAQSQDLPIATLDKKMRRVAKKLGMAIVSI